MAKPQYIGQKKIKVFKESGVTEMGTELIEVQYDDGKVEVFSKLMFDKIVDFKPCNDTELREKRVSPVLKIVLAIMREWGVKVGELPYLSTMLNQSLNYNSDQALLKLVGKYMPQPLSLDDVDYITIDRILKSEDARSEK